MTDKKPYVKLHRTDEMVIDCFKCEHHSYDSYGDDDYEICEKGYEIYPDDCSDFLSKSKIVCKEIKEITIKLKVCLPGNQEGYLADTNQLAKTACRILNEKQQRQKEKGYCWLQYEPVLSDIVK